MEVVYMFRIPMQFFAEDGDGTQPAGAGAQAADGGAQDPTPAPDRKSVV